MLSSIISNPKAMESIKDITNNLTDSKGKAEVENDENTLTPLMDNSLPDMSFLTEILANNQQSIQALTKMKKAYDTYNNTHDPSINLINALSPYLSTKRVANANKIITALKVGKAINVFRGE